MRPTKVRARVGSSASGSSASAIVSVPPFFAWCVLRALAAVTAKANSAAAAAVASATRLQLLVIDSPSTWDSEHPGARVPQRRHAETGNPRLDPIRGQMD